MYADIYNLYKCRCGVCLNREKGNAGMTFSLGEELKDTILKRIYGGFDVKRNIDPDLYKYTVNALDQAVDKGFSGVQDLQAEEDFIRELKHNNGVFAAFKTHRQQNDLHNLLTDEEGGLKSFARFKQDTEPVIGAYNTDWLQTEYTTAIKRARTAAEFRTYERESDLYPNVKWLPSAAVEPRDAHRPYYGMVRALSDPFWKSTYPGCLWGCQCGTANTDENITHGPGVTPNKETRPERGLEQNPAYSRACFSDRHPYRTDAYPGAGKAVENFMEKQEIKQQRADIRKWAKENLAERTVQAPGISNPVRFTMSGIKEAINQPHKFLKEKNEALKNIRELIRDGKYVKYAPDEKENPMVAGYHFIEIPVAGKKSYAVIRELLNGQQLFYSIVEKIKKK